MVTLLLRLTLLAYPLGSTYLTVAHDEGGGTEWGYSTYKVLNGASPAHVAPPKCGAECLG